MRLAATIIILISSAALPACVSQVPATEQATPSDPPRMALQLERHKLGQNDTIEIDHPQVLLHLPFGYYHILINGQDRYCHKETFTGSRLESYEQCLSKKQLEAIDDNKRDAMEQVKSFGTTCVYHAPAGGGGMGHCDGSYSTTTPIP